jgi:hypothetical protein
MSKVKCLPLLYSVTIVKECAGSGETLVELLTHRPMSPKVDPGITALAET